MSTYKPGDRVAYSDAFLQSTGQLTGPAAPTCIGGFARGTVAGVDDMGSGRQLVSILWDDGHLGRSLSCNLWGRNAGR